MARTVDRLIVIGRGSLIADATVQDFIDRSSRNHVRVRSPRADVLAALLVQHGASTTVDPTGVLEVTGMERKAFGEVAEANTSC